MSNDTRVLSSSPHNSTPPTYGSAADGWKNDPYKNVQATHLSFSVVIAVFSPVAVLANALILVAIWKKTFRRTQFHVLLSGLAITDFCTGLIAQPLVAAETMLWVASGCTSTQTVRAIGLIGEASAFYFIPATTLIISLMSIERWMHMSQRCLVTSRRGRCVVVAMLCLIPAPLVVSRALAEERPVELDIALVILSLFFFICTTVPSFNVLCIIRHHRQQVRANASSSSFGQPAINHTRSKTINYNNTYCSRIWAAFLDTYKKSMKTILYILTEVYLCFLPYAVSRCAHLYVKSNDSPEKEVVDTFFLVLVFLSSSLNPCLYVWRMRDVRCAVKNIFCWNS